jgi:hypothetical protein
VCEWLEEIPRRVVGQCSLCSALDACGVKSPPMSCPFGTRPSGWESSQLSFFTGLDPSTTSDGSRGRRVTTWGSPVAQKTFWVHVA